MWSLVKKIWNRENAKPVCGIGVLHTGLGDPFQMVCAVHDDEYIKKEEGVQKDSRRTVDKRFLLHMKSVIQYSRGMRFLMGYVKMYIYYGLVRSLGWLAW